MTLSTAFAIASFSRTGPVTVIAEGCWEYERLVPVSETWVQDKHVIAVGCRHPSYPERICVSKKAQRHAFGFWQVVAEFVVERYTWDSHKMQSVLRTDCWDGPVFEASI